MSSPASSVDLAPPTPVSPTTSDSPATTQQQAPKRKPNRRANTAERRATHNAVERQRRETLNGRFLDLAALLPNLATVRRPSKSAIVNSSIAIIHAHRRRITTSSRALRSIKQESDSLRRELNEWRARANLPRVDEPPRGDDFESLMMVEDEWENSAQEERRAYEMVAQENATDEDDALFSTEDFVQHQRAVVPVQQQPAQQPMLIQRSFDAHSTLFDPAAPVGSPDADKVAAWNAQLYSALAQQQQQTHHHQWTTPPPQHPFPPSTAPQQQQQPQFYQRVQQPTAHLFGVEDDASSVGSSDHNSVGASPHASYELAPAGFAVDSAFPRRPSISIPPANWVQQQQQQQQVRTPVSSTAIVGGGGGASFHPMAWMM